MRKIKLLVLNFVLLLIIPSYARTDLIAVVPTIASATKDTTIYYRPISDGKLVVRISNSDTSADGMFTIRVSDSITGNCIAYNEFFTTGTVPWGSRFYHSNPTDGLYNPEYEMSLTSNLVRTPPAGRTLRIRITYPYGTLYGTEHTGIDTLFLFFNDTPISSELSRATFLDSLVTGPFDASYHNYPFITECGTKLIAQVTYWGNNGGGDSYYIDGLGCGGTYTGDPCACEYYTFNIPNGPGSHTLTIAHEDDYWGDNTDYRAVKIYLVPLDPTIDSVWFSEETACNDSNWVNICYSLSGCPADVGVILSSDNGITWGVPMRTLRNAEGDFGPNTPTGIHCFEWLASNDFPNFETRNFAVGVTATIPHKFRNSTREDFSAGDTSHVRIVSPDPDGTDNGALWLPPSRDTIYVLQVYPDGHCTNCMSTPIYNYMRSGTPPLNIKIYLQTITSFNAQASSTTSLLTVQYIDPSGTISPPDTRRFDFFDVIIFGVADCYARYDLTPTSRDAVLSFVRSGKGIILTHDTATNWPDCLHHVNFCSLTDVTGISCADNSGWRNYTTVNRVYDPPSVPVLHAPFEIPASFSVLNCHWLRQIVNSGWILYIGNTTPGGPLDNLLYWHAYHNPAYNSFASFFNYGHTEAVPLEWEAKAMINCIYYSYHGGIGSGVYTSAREALGSCATISSADYSATVPSGSTVTIEISVDTLCGAGESWTGWISITSLPLPYLCDGIRYRVGLTRNPSGESPILHWIEFRYTTRETTIARAPLDTRNPSVAIACPTLVVGNEPYTFRWSVDDLFFANNLGWLDFTGCGIRQHYITGDTFFVWTPPFINCSACTLVVASRDSFCNWGYDTCQFIIRSIPPQVTMHIEKDSLVCLPNGAFAPNPMSVRAIVSNTGTVRADSVLVSISFDGRCFSLFSGRNPFVLYNYLPGETDTLIWEFNVRRDCTGTTECFHLNLRAFPD